jgi:hypothetical protein
MSYPIPSTNLRPRLWCTHHRMRLWIYHRWSRFYRSVDEPTRRLVAIPELPASCLEDLEAVIRLHGKSQLHCMNLFPNTNPHL